MHAAHKIVGSDPRQIAEKLRLKHTCGVTPPVRDLQQNPALMHAAHKIVGCDPRQAAEKLRLHELNDFHAAGLVQGELQAGPNTRMT